MNSYACTVFINKPLAKFVMANMIKKDMEMLYTIFTGTQQVWHLIL